MKITEEMRDKAGDAIMEAQDKINIALEVLGEPDKLEIRGTDVADELRGAYVMLEGCVTCLGDPDSE